jgi:nitrogen-specific signal transduction histidine kinase
MNATETFHAFSGLDLLSSAVVLVDAKLVIRHLNPAAENLFAVSSRQLLGHPLQRWWASRRNWLPRSTTR